MDKTPNVFVIRVAIQRPFYKLLDYEYSSDTKPVVGCRVRVPLGNSVITAIIVEVDVDSPFEKLKSVIELLDTESLFSSSMFDLLNWASKYYFYPLGEVLFHALPVALRKGGDFPKVNLWEANERGRKLDMTSLSRAPKQQEMLNFLRVSEGSSLQLQDRFGKNWRSIMRQLDQKQLIKQEKVQANLVYLKSQSYSSEKKLLTLTAEQQECVGKISDYFNEKKPKPILLHGITGSGKTEVYLRAAEPVLKAKKQVLVLVPEIGLTPQLLSRFKEHFNQSTIVSLHSSLATGERLQAWIGAQSGEVDVIIGTRSAVFTPMKKLGAIIIDEEHDASFKQQEGFMYHGRDMAIKRAYDSGIPLLLGSATPSLETLHNVEHQGYRYLRLGSRPGTSKPPNIVVQDVRTLPLEAGVSNLMMEEIRRHLDQNKQVMLFLNRRGFSPLLMCPDCGWHAACQHCDVGMTYYAAANKVVCHHCGQQQKVKAVCLECGGKRLTTMGQGTERVESILSTHFPDTSIIRIDRDSTSKKGSLERKLKKVYAGDPVILVGTQMLAKGHDFPNLTLVGILDVDQALFSIDYRAQERLAQQILQVSGRAGRGEDKGTVILQTCQPDHPLLLGLLSQGYYTTAAKILNERQTWGYPPFGAQALVKVSSTSKIAGKELFEKLRKVLDTNLDNSKAILGPMPSPLFKKANRYRYQLLFSTVKRGELHSLLHQVLSFLIKSRKVGELRWKIDVDPQDFF